MRQHNKKKTKSASTLSFRERFPIQIPTFFFSTLFQDFEAPEGAPKLIGTPYLYTTAGFGIEKKKKERGRRQGQMGKRDRVNETNEKNEGQTDDLS